MSPRLAVIITSYDSHAVLRRGLASLTAQPEAAEIVVADCSPQNPAELLAAEFPTVRFLHFDSKRVVPALRWSALEYTSAPIVGALESRCVAAPDWARRMIGAHEAAPQAPAVGGPVSAGTHVNAFELGLYFCEYGAFAPPVEEGPAAALSSANLSYKRSDLEAQRAYLDSGCWETMLHEQWLAEGRELRLCGAAIEFHNTMRPATALRQRFHYGRGYAAERAQSGAGRRWLYAAFCPLLPLLLTWRVGRSALAKGMGGPFVQALGWILLLHTVWSMGELWGYLFGADPEPRIF